MPRYLKVRALQTVLLARDVEVEAYVGVDQKERESLQTVLVTLECTLFPVIRADDIGATVNYAILIEEIRKLALKKYRTLLETFAEEISVVCLANRQVQNVTVTAIKPTIVPGSRGVGVRRTFMRDDTTAK